MSEPFTQGIAARQDVFNTTPAKKSSGNNDQKPVSQWPFITEKVLKSRSLADKTQNWAFQGGSWTVCQPYIEPFLHIEGLRTVEEAYEKAGYIKQIEIKRGTWRIIEGVLTLWVNESNPDLPIYCMTITGENGTIGTAYITTFPDLLIALDQLRGMILLFEGISNKNAQPAPNAGQG